MPIAETMSHMIPNHVLRVGQSIHLDSDQWTAEQSTCPTEPGSTCDESDLDVSLDNLNQLILELDPSFEPIQVNKSSSSLSQHADDSSPDEDVTSCVLVPRGCSPGISSSISSSLSHSIPIPMHARPSCSPHGSLVFSSSPASSRPPLPCGSVHRQNNFQKNEISSSQGCLRLSLSNRNSGTSLLSMSPGSDTSYILGSWLSLTGEDQDSSECLLTRTSGSFTEGLKTRPSLSRQSPDKPSLTKPSPLEHFQDLQKKGTHSSPASLSGSFTDIPLVLINGTREPQLSHLSAQPETPLVQTVHMSNSKPSSPHSLQAHFHGSQPSMKFVMDTSKFWFRPHLNRTEAEALVKDKEAGSFVVRDSTSYHGSFGLAMKVDQVPTGSPTSQPVQGNSEVVRHFLIESSAKGVRIKGSSIEPYFGSLSALVYQHTISAYALPCKLLLKCDDLSTGEEVTNNKTPSEDKCKTACNFLYLNAVPTEMLTGPCAVKKAVSSTLEKEASAITSTIVNLKVSVKGVTMTDINRKLFFRRHYPAHLLSYSGEDPEGRRWRDGASGEARMFGIVAKGPEAGMENVCHVFAEYDPLQPCKRPIDFIQGSITRC